MKVEPIYLASSRLRVEIAPAGSAYTRCRFDHSGNIRQVILDGNAHYTFCGEDSRAEAIRCGGFGLMNEFMPSDQGTFAQPDENGCFLKMGVGILQKVDALPYSQKTQYPIVQPVEIWESHTRESYTAVLYQPDFMGFAYQLKKSCTVRENTLTICYTVTNTGAKPLDFKEYAHNFYRLSPEGRAEDCTLRFSFPPLAETPETFIAANGELTVRPFADEVSASAVTGFDALPCHAEVYSRRTGQTVRETVGRGPARCFVWMLQDVVCPELILPLHAEPGQKTIWCRSYTFENKGRMKP